MCTSTCEAREARAGAGGRGQAAWQAHAAAACRAQLDLPHHTCAQVPICRPELRTRKAPTPATSAQHPPRTRRRPGRRLRARRPAPGTSTASGARAAPSTHLALVGVQAHVVGDEADLAAGLAHDGLVVHLGAGGDLAKHHHLRAAGCGRCGGGCARRPGAAPGLGPLLRRRAGRAARTSAGTAGTCWHGAAAGPPHSSQQRPHQVGLGGGLASHCVDEGQGVWACQGQCRGGRAQLGRSAVAAIAAGTRSGSGDGGASASAQHPAGARPHAPLDSGSCSRHASRMASDTWSASCEQHAGMGGAGRERSAAAGGRGQKRRIRRPARSLRARRCS